MNLLSFRIPLSLLTIINSNREMFKERDIINTYCLCSAIRTYYNYKHFRLKEDKDTYITIHNEVIRRVITSMNKDYKVLINKLLTLKILECNNSFSQGSFSLGYRFGPALLETEWQTISFTKFLNEFAPQTGHKKVFKCLHQRFLDSLVTHKSIPDGWQRDICDLTVNITPGLGHSIEDIKAFAHTLAARKAAESEKGVQKEHYLYNINCSLTAIEEKNISPYINVEGFSNRLHSAITNMPKEIRFKLTYKNKPLINLDVRSSQFLLLATFYTNSAAHQQEKKKFINIVENQDVYSLLGDEGGFSREVAKQRIYIVMFGQNYIQKNPMSDAFRKLFPLLSQQIYLAKETNFKNVAATLQNIESKIVLENTLLPLLRAGVAAFSIHDSLLVTQENVLVAKDALTQAFKNEIGITPFIREES